MVKDLEEEGGEEGRLLPRNGSPSVDGSAGGLRRGGCDDGDECGESDPPRSPGPARCGGGRTATTAAASSSSLQGALRSWQLLAVLGALSVTICYVDRANIATAILPMSKGARMGGG